MKKLALATACALLLAASNATAAPLTIDGITFPDGAVSFADAVVSYAPGPDVGGTYDDPLDALGLPDYDGTNGSTSLGNSGVLILRFTDNSLTTSGDATADLHVFEIGGVTEFFNLAISLDGFTWVDLGNVLGQPTSVNIDGKPGVVSGAKYSFVRLTDVAPDQTGFPFGEADIDAVGAISSAEAVPTVPEPGTLFMLGSAMLGVVAIARRRRAQ
jgi:hypothetical protein